MNGSNKLWVDDIRQAPDDTWMVARSITSAVNAIQHFEFEEISLDHDISHQVSVGELSRPYPCPECFCPVAWLLKEKMWGREASERPRITIHTSNPVGAVELEAILEDFAVTKKPMGLANRLEMEV